MRIQISFFFNLNFLNQNQNTSTSLQMRGARVSRLRRSAQRRGVTAFRPNRKIKFLISFFFFNIPYL